MIYFESEIIVKKMSDQEKLIACKVVMIGNPGVGKTSLVNQWINDKFIPKYAPTIGANHLRKLIQIDNETIDVSVWDTAGQEQYLSLAPLYTRASACAIAVASIDDMDSFEGLSTWVNLMKESCEEVPPIILAVSKTDLTTPDSPTEEFIETHYGDGFLGIFYTSAKTGENVSLLFTQAAKAAVKFLRSKQLYNTEGINLQTKEKEKACC